MEKLKLISSSKIKMGSRNWRIFIVFFFIIFFYQDSKADSTLVFIHNGRYEKPIALDSSYFYFYSQIDTNTKHRRVVKFYPEWKKVSPSGTLKAGYVISNASKCDYVFASNYKINEYFYLIDDKKELQTRTLYPGVSYLLNSYFICDNNTYLDSKGCVEKGTQKIILSVNGIELPKVFEADIPTIWFRGNFNKHFDPDFVLLYDNQYLLFLSHEYGYKTSLIRIIHSDINEEF